MDRPALVEMELRPAVAGSALPTRVEDASPAQARPHRELGGLRELDLAGHLHLALLDLADLAGDDGVLAGQPSGTPGPRVALVALWALGTGIARVALRPGRRHVDRGADRIREPGVVRRGHPA